MPEDGGTRSEGTGPRERRADGGAQPDDTMRERGGGSTWKLWVLLEADRWVVTAVLLAGLFGAMVALGALDPSPLQQAVATSDPTETLFQAYVTAIVTGVTLVVTLNQLVLSQELGPVGDQRERMEGAMSFREDVSAVLDDPAGPPEPAAFLQAMVEETRSRAQRLDASVRSPRDGATPGPDEELRERVRSYVAHLTANADAVSATLEDAEFGSYGVLSAVLDFNYSWKLYAARRLQNEHAEALSDDARDALDDLEEVLALFGPAREHFKTLYFQWALVDLSRAMLYAALPALVVASGMVVYYDARAFPGATLGVSNDVLAVSLAVTVSSIPFVLLLSYVLRIATVAQHTLAIGPFVLRDVDRIDEFDWK